jgi:hypothetical protein
VPFQAAWSGLRREAFAVERSSDRRTPQARRSRPTTTGQASIARYPIGAFSIDNLPRVAGGRALTTTLGAEHNSRVESQDSTAILRFSAACAAVGRVVESFEWWPSH